MDWQNLIGPAVVAALVSGVITLTGTLFSQRSARSMHREKLQADIGIAEKKADADIALAEKKANADVALAERKFDLDKLTAQVKRQTDLAETVLQGFYQARSLFKSARVPFSQGSEGSTRPRAENEPDTEKSYKDALYAPLERLNKGIEQMNELNALRYRFSANFGDDTEAHFQALIISYNQVHSSTYMLMADRDGKYSQTLRMKLETDIGWNWSPSGSPDEIEERIETAVKAIEAVCAPLLRHGTPTA